MSSEVVRTKQLKIETNKTGTSKVGAVSKAQRMMKFWRKNFRENMKTLYPTFENVISEL